MERRREPRFACCEEATVTLLSDPEVRVAVRVTNISVSGMTVEMARPAPPGSRLRIEFQGALAIGEVISCRSVAGGCFVGIRLEQAMNSLADLALALEGLDRLHQEDGVRTP